MRTLPHAVASSHGTTSSASYKQNHKIIPRRHGHQDEAVATGTKSDANCLGFAFKSVMKYSVKLKFGKDNELKIAPEMKELEVTLKGQILIQRLLI